MKKASILLAAAFAVTVLLVSWKAESDNAADVVTEFGCGMSTPDGFFVTTASHSVVTSSGNTSLVCQFENVPNSTGRAWRSKGDLCNTMLGLTTNTSKVVTPSGNGTLVCQVKSPK